MSATATASAGQKDLLVSIHGQVPCELGHHQPGQHAGTEGTLLDGLRRSLRRDDLVSLSACGTGVGVAYVLDDIRLGWLHLQLLSHAFLDDDTIRPAVAAGALLGRQWIVPTLPRQELGEHDPLPTTLERAIVSWRRLFVGRVLGFVFRWFLADSTFQRRWREQVPLLGVRCKALPARREEGLLQKRDLFGRAFELLVVCSMVACCCFTNSLSSRIIRWQSARFSGEAERPCSMPYRTRQELKGFRQP